MVRSLAVVCPASGQKEKFSTAKQQQTLDSATHTTFFLIKVFLLFLRFLLLPLLFHYILRFARECFIFRRGTSHIAEEFSFFLRFCLLLHFVAFSPSLDFTNARLLLRPACALFLRYWLCLHGETSHFFASSSLCQRFFLFNLISYCLRFANVNILYLRRPIQRAGGSETERQITFLQESAARSMKLTIIFGQGRRETGRGRA